jgi:hypothetical protein
VSEPVQRVLMFSLVVFDEGRHGEIWNLEFGIWNLDFGFRNLDFGFRISDFGFGIWNFEFPA